MGFIFERWRICLTPIRRIQPDGHIRHVILTQPAAPYVRWTPGKTSTGEERTERAQCPDAFLLERPTLARYRRPVNLAHVVNEKVRARQQTPVSRY